MTMYLLLTVPYRRSVCAIQGNCSITSTSRCASGRSGFLCSECSEPGYAAWGKSCKPCKQLSWLTLFIALCK